MGKRVRKKGEEKGGTNKDGNILYFFEKRKIQNG
jgi:hypothetical protein